MPRLSSVDRERAIGMLNSNVPSADVARQFGVSPTTITRLRDRLQQTGATADRPRSGRPRVTTPGQDRHIRLTHLRQRFRPATLTARETMGRHNARISDQTVRNRLRCFGLRARRPYRGPILNQARRNTRLQWVTQRLGWRAREWGGSFSPMSPDFVSLTVMDGSAYGAGRVSDMLMLVSSSRTAGVAGV